jgi:hypothetical protein
MNEHDFLSEMMGLNPQDLNVFHEPENTSTNSNIYRTSPSESKSDDGHYRCNIRVLYNPFDPRNSVVNSLRYSCKDEDGFFQVQSALVHGDKNCPLFKAWKQLWFSKDESKKEWAKQMFDRSESKWALVQIIEDENHPELKGTIKAMKLPKVIFNKMTAKMNPAPESKKQPVALMDYLFGPVLEMDVTPGPDDPQNPKRKFREISYDLCEFATEIRPIINIDGTELFSDAELELIEEYNSHKTALQKAKTQAAKDKEQAQLDQLTPQIRDCYAKAIKFMKDNSFDLQKECGYTPWTDELKARVDKWINAVLKMQDPSITTVNEVEEAAKEVVTDTTNPVSGGLEDPNDPFNQAMQASGDDLPF